MREAKDKHSNICVPDLCHIKLGWLIHPLQNYSILHQKDAIWQKRRMHLQSIAFPTKWVGGWERLNINPVHCEGGSLAAELWRVGDILRHITTRNSGIRAVQKYYIQRGLANHWPWQAWCFLVLFWWSGRALVAMWKWRWSPPSNLRRSCNKKNTSQSFGVSRFFFCVRLSKKWWI